MDDGKIGKFLVVWEVGSSRLWGNMEEVRKCVTGWERCGRVYGVSVEGVGKCVEVWGRVEKEWGRCRIVWGAHTLFYTSPHTSSHLPQQFFTALISFRLHFPIFPHTLSSTPYQNF